MKRFIVLLLLSTQVAARDYTIAQAQPQAKQIASDDWFGCTGKPYFFQLAMYAVQREDDAFSRLLSAGLLTGECVLFKENEDVFITELSIDKAVVKVHRRGNLIEFWTAIEAIGY